MKPPTTRRIAYVRAAAEAGFTPRVRFQTASYDVAQALVGTGIGVALVSRLALPRRPGTTHRELARPWLHRQLHAVTATEASLTPLAVVFLALLRDIAEDTATTWTVHR
ncbi:LysR substrate-binding domain-containing protein [Streptomyces sp. NPDC001185]|uniref:LysR substrate-binding domain-containing protein n=1 Tax=Streptomyces sp. NPDC001185 TaxID=3154380 RepID=UPI003317859C